MTAQPRRNSVWVAVLPRRAATVAAVALLTACTTSTGAVDALVEEPAFAACLQEVGAGVVDLAGESPDELRAAFGRADHLVCAVRTGTHDQLVGLTSEMFDPVTWPDSLDGLVADDDMLGRMAWLAPVAGDAVTISQADAQDVAAAMLAALDDLDDAPTDEVTATRYRHQQQLVLATAIQVAAVGVPDGLDPQPVTGELTRQDWEDIGAWYDAARRDDQPAAVAIDEIAEDLNEARDDPDA